MSHEGFPLIGKVFFSLCNSVNSAISLGAWLRYKYNQLALAEMEIHPRDYLDAESFQDDYLIVSFLSKYKGLSTGLNLEDEAVRKFISSEDQCRETNDRLKMAREKGFDSFAESVIHTARRKISSVLGDYDSFDIDRDCGWGPGATDDIPRRSAAIDTKICKIPLSCTASAVPVMERVMAADLHWSARILNVDVGDLAGPFSFLRDKIFDIVDGCIIDTVPKNAKTHRVIAKEPRANGFLQKSYGAYIRRRLKRVGIDLDSQGFNQRGAYLAFSKGLSTLDLKSASDSIAIEVVFDLLPLDWAFGLHQVRSRQGKLPDGSWRTLQKFSSMGNGFTFELETLIFYALSWAVKTILREEGEVLVYGDDIIVPRAVAPKLVEILALLGFETNSKKSFVEGCFFESCGKHYFMGYDVTPIYQKEKVEDVEELLRMGNRLMRLAYRFGSGNSLYGKISSAWRTAYRAGGASTRFQLPLGAEGDDGWLVPAREFRLRPFDVNLGFRCRTIRNRTRQLVGDDRSLLAWTLRRGCQTEQPFNGMVSFAPLPLKSTSLPEGSRWLMPSGDFGLDFEQ